MTKSDLSSHVATEASLSKAQASAVVDTVFSAISDALTRDERVAIPGFGTFATGKSDLAPRSVVSPPTASSTRDCRASFPVALALPRRSGRCSGRLGRPSRSRRGAALRPDSPRPFRDPRSRRRRRAPVAAGYRSSPASLRPAPRPRSGPDRTGWACDETTQAVRSGRRRAVACSGGHRKVCAQDCSKGRSRGPAPGTDPRGIEVQRAGVGPLGGAAVP